MKLILTIAISLLLGCGEYGWQSAPRKYTCTDEQMSKVEKESLWCIKNVTEYNTGYCYGTAIIRNCQPLNRESNHE